MCRLIRDGAAKGKCAGVGVSIPRRARRRRVRERQRWRRPLAEVPAWLMLIVLAKPQPLDLDTDTNKQAVFGFDFDIHPHTLATPSSCKWQCSSPPSAPSTHPSLAIHTPCRSLLISPHVRRRLPRPLLLSPYRLPAAPNTSPCQTDSAPPILSPQQPSTNTHPYRCPCAHNTVDTAAA